jgi:hypothetical protein
MSQNLLEELNKCTQYPSVSGFETGFETKNDSYGIDIRYSSEEKNMSAVNNVSSFL